MSITTGEFSEMVSELDIKLFADHTNSCQANEISFDHPCVSGKIKEIKTADIHISDNRVTSHSEIQLSGTTKEVAMTLCFALEGSNTYRYENAIGNGEEVWMAGDFNIWFTPDTSGYSRFQTDDRFRMIEVMVSGQYLEKIATVYPHIIENAYERFLCGESFRLSDYNIPMTPAIRRVIKEITLCRLMGNAGPLYLDAKILELLSLFIKEKEYKKEIYHSPLRQQDKERIYAARDILTRNYLAPPSLRELARMAGTNECKLKTGFKNLFGNTVFGYLFDYRMQKAVSYLLDTDKPVQEIATLTGYEHQAHFTNAFKRRFGMNPTEYRRI